MVRDWGFAKERIDEDISSKIERGVAVSDPNRIAVLIIQNRCNEKKLFNT